MSVVPIRAGQSPLWYICNVEIIKGTQHFVEWKAPKLRFMLPVFQRDSWLSGQLCSPQIIQRSPRCFILYIMFKWISGHTCNHRRVRGCFINWLSHKPELHDDRLKRWIEWVRLMWRGFLTVVNTQRVSAESFSLFRPLFSFTSNNFTVVLQLSFCSCSETLAGGHSGNSSSFFKTQNMLIISWTNTQLSMNPWLSSSAFQKRCHSIRS